MPDLILDPISFRGVRILGQSPAIRALQLQIQQFGPSSATVLIQGESGTGKELIANAIQQQSHRRSGPFIKVNCAAIPDALMESELFGHERGAFTGAIRSRKGRFELAHQGTLFLDEVGDMSPSTQMKLLRVLQEGEFDRVGGSRTQQVDVRVIAATNRDLKRAVREGRFREDLYYRLRVLEIALPPLRDRKEDIPFLVEEFIQRYAQKNAKRIQGVLPEVLSVLLDHVWPGNVRELENVIERAVVLAQEESLRLCDLSAEMQKTAPGVHPSAPESQVTFRVGSTLREMELRMIDETLRHTGGDKNQAAALLGISVRTIYRKLGQRHRTRRSSEQPGTTGSPEASPSNDSDPGSSNPPTPHLRNPWSRPSGVIPDRAA